jgi:histidinol-phosphate aminotransferase
VAILRTLSKVGFAALRVGWLVGQPALVAELDKVRLPYNLATVCQQMATTVLTELSTEITAVREAVISERDRLCRSLSALRGVGVAPSQANFLWLTLPVAAEDAYNSLKKRGVLVRSFHGRGGRLEQCVRVTVGSRQDNDRFLDALQASL